MAAQASAGIAFSERALRYAEIQQTEKGFRLLRLGQCDFDFDLNRTLVDPNAGAEREIIAEALKEAMGTSSVRRVRAALHPPLCRSFFSAHGGGDPVDDATFEARLLGFASTNGEEGIGADAAAAIGSDELLHVTAIRPAVLENLGVIVAELEAEDAQAVSAIRASAEVVRLGGVSLSANGYILAVGHYENLFELSIVDATGWRFALHSRALQDDADAAFRVAQALSVLGKNGAKAERVLAYGARPVPGTMMAAFGAPVEPLNPLVLLDLDRDSLDPDYTAAEFVPAVGAALL